MDNHAALPSEHQQYQQYYQHYQQQQPLQQQPEVTNPTAYDPLTQVYYPSVQQYNPNPHQPQEAQAQPDYSSYYYPDYSTSYPPHAQTDPNSVHPPGVTVPAELPQTHAQNHRDVYFHHWFENLQQQNQQQQHQQRQQIVYMAPGHPTAAARGGRGGKPNRGGRHGVSRGGGRGGRGRGGMRGGTVSVNHIPLGTPRQGPQPQPSSSSSAPGHAARMAWCEICKVDCNTPEVLEQHKNGKKHIRNLKVYEELQSIKPQVELPTPQILNPASATAQPECKEGGGSAAKLPISSDAVAGNSNGGVDTPKDSAKSSGAPQISEERVQIGGGARGGIKRKIMRGGRGGKLIKSSNGSRKPAETKKTIDLFCELCNVKCESQVVFNSHMAGKKHLSNIKRLQPAAAVPSLQALYPAATQSAAQQGGAVQDPQAALVQLLNQHGVQDAHSLLSQMIPVLLTQVLPNVAASAQPASGLDNVTGEHASAGESKPDTVAVDQSVQGSLDLQKEETMEPPTDASTNTSSVDGRGDSEQVPEDSTKQAPSL